MSIETERPAYLYNAAECPCPRGETANCPRYRHCDACVAYHRGNPNTPFTACEKRARAEIGEFEVRTE